MRMKGRIPYIDSNNPDAWGRCDKTGLPVMYSDLRPQMQYVGNTLMWTGWMVHEKDLDEPNPQTIPPRLKPDPVPVKNPRFFPLPAQPEIPTNLKEVTKTKDSITVEWDAVQGADQYAVYWQSSFGTGSTFANSRPIEEVKKTEFTIKNLTPGTTYTLAVASVNVTIKKGINPQEEHPILIYTVSSPSYGPDKNVYGGRIVLNPYHVISATTLSS